MPRKIEEEEKPPLQFRDSFLLPLAFAAFFLLHWLADNKAPSDDVAMALNAVGNVAGFIGLVMGLSMLMDKSKKRGKKKVDI